MKTLEIEMIHDLVCSWCHIGYHNINRALDALSTEMSAEVAVEFRYLPFQLNPTMGPAGEEITEHLCRRNQWSVTEAMDYRQRLLATTRDLGVVIDFSKRTHYYNTAHAHRLMAVATGAGVQRQMHQALLQAYHVEGRDISDLAVLVEVAQQVGLEEAVVIQSMNSDVINRQLQALSERVSHYNVRSVPAFVFNGSHFVSGSHTADFFERLIRSEFLSEENTQSEEKAQCPM